MRRAVLLALLTGCAGAHPRTVVGGDAPATLALDAPRGDDVRPFLWWHGFRVSWAAPQGLRGLQASVQHPASGEVVAWASPGDATWSSPVSLVAARGVTASGATARLHDRHEASEPFTFHHTLTFPAAAAPARVATLAGWMMRTSAPVALSRLELAVSTPRSTEQGTEVDLTLRLDAACEPAPCGAPLDVELGVDVVLVHGSEGVLQVDVLPVHHAYAWDELAHVPEDVPATHAGLPRTRMDERLVGLRAVSLVLDAPHPVADLGWSATQSTRAEVLPRADVDLRFRASVPGQRRATDAPLPRRRPGRATWRAELVQLGLFDAAIARATAAQQVPTDAAPAVLQLHATP